MQLLGHTFPGSFPLVVGLTVLCWFVCKGYPCLLVLRPVALAEMQGLRCVHSRLYNMYSDQTYEKSVSRSVEVNDSDSLWEGVWRFSIGESSGEGVSAGAAAWGLAMIRSEERRVGKECRL